MLSLNYGRFAYKSFPFSLLFRYIWLHSYVTVQAIKAIHVSQLIFTLQWGNLVALARNEIYRLAFEAWRDDRCALYKWADRKMRTERGCCHCHEIINPKSTKRTTEKTEQHKEKHDTVCQRQQRFGYFWFARVYKQARKKMQICAECLFLSSYHCMQFRTVNDFFNTPSCDFKSCTI